MEQGAPAMHTDRKPSGMARGQALIELAAGLFVAALVLSSVFAFASYIIASMDAQRRVRADAGRAALGSSGSAGSYSSSTRGTTVTVPPLAGERIFGGTSVSVKEEVHIPAAGIAW